MMRKEDEKRAVWKKETVEERENRVILDVKERMVLHRMRKREGGGMEGAHIKGKRGKYKAREQTMRGRAWQHAVKASYDVAKT